MIGVSGLSDKNKILEIIKPQYIILKPSFLGGWKKSQEWIKLADERNIGFWVTSALESNIGLNAIAQWTATLNTETTHGLGTGMLYINNFNSPLAIVGSSLIYDNRKRWEIDL